MIRAATTTDPRQMAPQLEAPDADAITTEALSWPDRARALVVTDAASYVAAGELLLGIKLLSDKADATFDPNIRLWRDGHKASIAMKAEVKAPLLEAEQIIKSGLVTYDQEQERIRRVEQARLDEIARQQREQDAIERAAVLEREGVEYGDAAMVSDAHALINDTIEQPIAATTLVLKATPKVAGVVMRTDWSATCTNLLELVKHIAAHPEHLNLVQFNQTAGTSLARAQRDRLNVPGVRAVSTQRVAAGR